jgi:uncharacterized damage-inducible protein DinB
MKILRHKVSLAICIFFSLSSFAQTSDSLLNQLSRKWANAKTYIIKVAELMPEEAYHYKPVSETMSFKEQLLHIAGNIQWLSSAYLFETTELPKSDTGKLDKTAMLQYISDVYELGLNAHSNFEQNKLDEIVPFFAGPMSRRQILILMHDHQTHHAGQLVYYLRLKGIKPPNYTGW